MRLDLRGRPVLVRRNDADFMEWMQPVSPWLYLPLAGLAGCLGYLPGRPSGRPFRQFFQRAETKGFRRAGCDAGWFLSLRNQVQAEITLVHPPFGAKLGNPKGACHQAEMAAETLMLIHDHDSIVGSLSDGASRANRLTGRIPAMETR